MKHLERFVEDLRIVHALPFWTEKDVLLILVSPQNEPFPTLHIRDTRRLRSY